MTTLKGRIAVVAGATRGAGRGIACMLGEAGATVYCTGRSVRGRPATGDRPETIEETAEMVTAHGGEGIAVQVDHTDEAQVEALFAQVENEAGGLDLLVNDVWGGDALTEWTVPFWQLEVSKGFQMIERAIHSHIITSRHGAPLMLGEDSSARAAESHPGVIFEITDGNSFGYRGNLFYDLVKTAVIRLAFAMATELKRKNIAAVAVTPGFLRSEAMLEHFGVTEENWRDGAKKDPNFIASETPYFVGRAIAALAADANINSKSGRVFSSWDLSDEYGFNDIDGESPHWGRHFEETFAQPIKVCDEAFYENYWRDGILELLDPNWP